MITCLIELEVQRGKTKKQNTNMHRFLLEIFLVTLSKSNDEAFILAIIHLSMLFNTQIVLEMNYFLCYLC